MEQVALPTLDGDEWIIPFTAQQHYWRRLYQDYDWLNRLSAVSALQLRGPLDVDILRKCLEELTARHQSLRAAIVLDNQNSYQRIRVSNSVELDVVSAEEDPHRADDLVNEFAAQRCDLTSGPLFRTRLIKLSEHNHVLVWGINHLISDGQSINIMFREIWQSYAAHLQKRPPSTAEKCVDFSDYVLWQMKEDGHWQNNHRQYWASRLEAAVGIQWPESQPANPSVTATLAQTRLLFSANLSNRIADIARRRRTPPSLGVLALYAAAVAGWCGQNDFIIETVANGRDRPKYQHILGFLSHSVYLRIQLTGRETFTELLDVVTREYTLANLHKDFGALVCDTPHLSAGGLFQWLSWGLETVSGNPSLTECAAMDLETDLWPIRNSHQAPSNFNFLAGFWNSAAGIHGWLLSQQHLFPGDSLAAFATHLQLTAERLVADPLSPVVS